MVDDRLFSRIFGCMIGNAIGDAIGAVIEGITGQEMIQVVGSDWIKDYLPYPNGGVDDRLPDPWMKVGNYHYYGVWERDAPRGTGTDDTRNNHILAECVIRNGGYVNSHFLAIEYIERYREPARFYRKHPDLAEMQYRRTYEQSCAYLGMRDLPTGAEAWVVEAQGDAFPMLSGLISLAFAGLLYNGEPEKAYRKAFELSYLDVGYARDATAMLAAMVSAAIGGKVDAREMIEVGLRTDPYAYGGRRTMARTIRRFLQIADAAESERDLANALAREVSTVHIYDPVDVLGFPVAAIYYADGDPLRSISIAANDRIIDDEGNLVLLRDVDCTAGVAGALVGALHGIEAFPQDWVEDTLRANADVNNIDIEKNARRFTEAVYGT